MYRIPAMIPILCLLTKAHSLRRPTRTAITSPDYYDLHRPVFIDAEIAQLEGSVSDAVCM